jgi:hypothetical protein
MKTTDILLTDIFKLNKWNEYKLHLGCMNEDKDEPLDLFVKSMDEWVSWNRYRGKKNDFNRKYIFSVINYYHEPSKWLFGGIFEVKKRHSDGYEVELLSDYSNLIGRLVFSFSRPQGLRGRAFLFEKLYKEFTVSEIFKSKYSGENFCGYENIDHDFSALESIFKTQKLDWKGALENVKGVYMIIDKSNGRKYIGSAYGESGIWSRWACYIGTGHGWNDELTTLIKKEGFGYARKNFKLSLLEYRAMKTDDAVIINRESYWKEALLSRGDFGYNKN